MESGDTGLADMYGQLADSTGLNMTKELQSLSDTDLSAIGEHIGVLTEAIESGNGTAEELAAWKEELQGLQDFIAAIPEGLTNETGTDISEGIGEGMKNYGFDADAQTVAGYIDTALRTATGAHSPATLTKPIGKDVSEGIGKGMLEYSFTEAAQVAKDIVDAFDGLDGDGKDIGKDFAKGLAHGITNGSSQVIEAAKKTAEAAIRAAKEKLEISSPSKVGAELGGGAGRAGRGRQAGGVRRRRAAAAGRRGAGRRERQAAGGAAGGRAAAGPHFGRGNLRRAERVPEEGSVRVWGE